MEAAIRDSMLKSDPPLSSKTTSSATLHGLPDGWSMDQWREYGSEWLKENQDQIQQFKHYRHRRQTNGVSGTQ